MVGTLLKMIASPNITHKPLDKSKSPQRRSPIQATVDKTEEENLNITDHNKDERAVQLGQNGSEGQATTVAHEDDDIDSTDANSLTFQCSCKVWSCTQCTKAFTSARALKIHEVKQHENMPKRYIKCTHCDEVFDHGNLLQIHMKVHHNIKVQCPQCKDLPKPINTKTHQPEPMCPVCGVKFDHDKLLKLHMEHYHKVSRKEAIIPTDQQTFQPVSTLLSPNPKSPDSRTLSPDPRRRTPSPRSPRSPRHFSRPYYETNSDDSSSRNSLSPRDVPSDRERFNLYPQRPLLTVPQGGLYLPFHDGGPPPYGPMGYFPHGVRRNIEKRPLGRSHSFPLKQDTGYPDVPVMPWQMQDAAYPVMYGVPRDKKIDRAALEAMRNSLKAKLRSVEETLLREETELHQPLSPTMREVYENQRYFRGRDEEVSHQYRPSVITPRIEYGGFSFKRQAPPSNLEPTQKIRALDKGDDSMPSPSRSPGQSVTFSPRTRENVPSIFEPRDVPKVARDDLAIPNLQREFFDDQAKIFIKRGAPRCNRCQQTFCSKMEYLHHLISHREKDGLVDASPEEMEFIEDVKRSMDGKNFAVGEMLESRYRTTSTNSSDSLSPKNKNTLDAMERSPLAKFENVSDEKGSTNSPSPANPNSLGNECMECKEVFADSTSYQTHIEKRHMKPRCRECGLTFDHKNLLKIHMDCYHSTLEVLQCYYCGMSFKQRSAFLNHVTTHETQDINNRDRANEQSADASETGGRRRWGRLVASAQLPAEKLDLRDRERVDDRLQVREALSLKSQTKQKLRKTVSLSTYTDMINRQKRSHAQFLHETRSKGDEAIGKEMRTRIFLPNFEDKMENLSRFASSSVQLAKKRVSPPPQENPVQDNGNYLRFHRHNLPPSQEVERSPYHEEGRAPFNADEGKAYPYAVQKRKLVRLKRSAPVDENDEMRAGRLAFPLRKAFVRDEVENLYQMRHKKALSTEVSSTSIPDPLDHRNALVKIERVEVDPSPRQTGPPEQNTSEMEERRPSAIVHQQFSDSDECTITTERNSSIKNLVQPTVSTVSPPPLIDVRLCTQSSTASSVSETNTTSNGPEPPSVKPEVIKAKLEKCDSSPIIGEFNDKQGKGKRRNSIKRLTKEALINSLSLKRRASAPDLYQFHRDQSTESAPDDKEKIPKRDVSPGIPSIGSPAKEKTASPDTKHHGSRSLYYTPRRQSDRDVTCVQCGVSFGHKKLYKIHLDSYHGKMQEHECLQCGAKNFHNKDEFVKHLMAHQNEGKVGDDFNSQDSTSNDQGLEHSDVNYDNGSEVIPSIQKIKNDSREGGETGSSDEERARYSPHASTSDQPKRKDNSKTNHNVNDSINKKTCLFCGKTFENGKLLEQHFSSHAMISDDGRFCCVICNKPFETMRKLEVHSRSHTGFKPHKCEQCGRCFPYYSSYYYHKMTHTKDRPHKCPICGKGFIQTRYLRSHLTTHKDEQGSLSDEVESIIRKAELTMNDETDEESIDSPGTAEGSPFRANDEETATAEILCSFKRGLNCSTQNSDSEQSPVMLQTSE